MAVLIELEFSGVSARQYDTVDRKVGSRSSKLPEGLLFHSATITDAGLRVVDLWESPEAFERFFERAQPVIKEVGITGRPDMKTTEVHNHFVNK